MLAGPMFAALRRKYPTATLHVLQLKKNQEVSRLLQLAAPEHLHSLDDSSGSHLLRDILILLCFQRYRCYPFESCKTLHSFGV